MKMDSFRLAYANGLPKRKVWIAKFQYQMKQFKQGGFSNEIRCNGMGSRNAQRAKKSATAEYLKSRKEQKDKTDRKAKKAENGGCVANRDLKEFRAS